MEHSLENNKEHVRSVKTFVIFDTETTGLPSPGNNPRITELCFIALTREELLTQQRESRVLNKLLICFNPRKNISSKSSDISGLHNDALEALAPFGKQASLVSMFLKNLPQPACLIAHNGNRFDFPLLVSHLKYANEEVPDGILCADSLEAFRMLDGLPPVYEYAMQKINTKMACASPVTKGTHITKSSNMINEASGNIYSERRTHEAFKGNCKPEDTNIDQKLQVVSSDFQKRSADADSDSLVSHDIKYKQAKLCSHQTEVWNKCEHTPHKSSLGITDSYISQSMLHSGVDQFEKRNEVKRQLFESECEKRENTHDQVSSIQSNCDESLVCNEGAESYPKMPEKNEDIEEFSMRHVMRNSSMRHVMRNSLDVKIDASQLLTKPEIFDNLTKDSERTKPEIFDNKTKDSEETKPSWNNEVSEKKSCSRIEPDLNVCNPSQNKTYAYKSSSQVKQPSYKFHDVYFRVFNQRPEAAHTAEGDCSNLLKVIRNKMHRFVTWCDKHAVPLKNINPMY